MKNIFTDKGINITDQQLRDLLDSNVFIQSFQNYLLELNRNIHILLQKNSRI